MLQKTRERRTRHHRLKTRQRAGVRPLLHNAQNEMQAVAEKTIAGCLFRKEV